ncbi:MAG: PCP reductase family protein [Rhodothermales bacterium]|nr:PCP reductase family protein [Rhodothermales bacterium]
MRFLCVECDEAMNLTGTRGPDAGAMTVLFGCPGCGRAVAMLTNPMETQMVRALGVKIGGRTVPAEPMETLRSALAHPRADAVEAAAEAEPAAAPKAAKPSGGTCPFTGMVEEAVAAQQPAAPRWTPEAEARLGRIPPYARPMVQKGIEDYAREQGVAEIDDAVMDAVRSRFGM